MTFYRKPRGKASRNSFRLTPAKQREYTEYIESAKRDSVKKSRIEKIIPLVLEKKGLYDIYKNC